MIKSLAFLAVATLLLASCTTSKINLDNLNNRAMTNISAQHEATKPVSTKPLFKGQEGTTTALQIQKDGLLDKHITKVPALLVCISGEVVFENEQGLIQTLTTGDYIHIEPMVTHWVRGTQDSQLLLLK